MAQLLTLKGEVARFEVRYADGSEIEDHEFGRQGYLTATQEEAEEIASKFARLDSPVQIVALG